MAEREAEATSATPERFRLGLALLGLVFVATGALGVAGLDGEDSAWLWVGLLVSAGVAGLTSAIEEILWRYRR